MDKTASNFKKDEQVAAGLGALYARRGYRQVQVGKFEDYGLYMDNKNFLHSNHIITFMDMDGKLLALKPDVTLSIVKNIPKKKLPAFEKLYYQDEVYRVSKESREYKVHHQMGVELIGSVDLFCNLEIIDLALESLRVISERFVLDISHQGFVSGLLEEAGLSHSRKGRVLSALYSKSEHGVRDVLDENGISPQDRERVLALSRISGNFCDVLSQAKALAGPSMGEALGELERLGEMLSAGGLARHVNLDFSVVNDLDYYNGLIFHGYVEGVPGVVLTGGRYDNLLKKMGKDSGAIGFAVELTELNTYIKSGRTEDFDILLHYTEDCDYPALLAAVRELCAQGKSVRLEREGGDASAVGIRCKAQYRFADGKLIKGDG